MWQKYFSVLWKHWLKVKKRKSYSAIRSSGFSSTVLFILYNFIFFSYKFYSKIRIKYVIILKFSFKLVIVQILGHLLYYIHSLKLLILWQLARFIIVLGLLFYFINIGRYCLIVIWRNFGSLTSFFLCYFVLRDWLFYWKTAFQCLMLMVCPICIQYKIVLRIKAAFQQFLPITIIPILLILAAHLWEQSMYLTLFIW